MAPNKDLEQELKERMHTKDLEKLTSSMAEACVSNGNCYRVDGGKKIFVKTNCSSNSRVMFDGEYESLKLLKATKTILVPEPISVIHDYDSKGSSAIVMEFLDMKPLSPTCAASLGYNLAMLHDYNSKCLRFNVRESRWVGRQKPSTKHAIQKDNNQATWSHHEDDEERNEDDDEGTIQISKHSVSVTKCQQSVDDSTAGSNDLEYSAKFMPQPGAQAIEEFGFNVPTSCGAVPQINEWTREWIPFFARFRLDSMIRMLLSEHSDRDLNEQWSHLQLKIDKFFTDFDTKNNDNIVPAILHGDLWSGNAAQLIADGAEHCGAVYDPATFYGHSEYDLGILRMFGGFPREFEQAYFETLPKRRLFEARNKLYQLFHHFNHWIHFGSGYRPSSLKIMRDLNASKLS